MLSEHTTSVPRLFMLEVEYYGFIPALGTSFNFAVYVLTLHVVWSLGSSIALAEAVLACAAN